MDEMDSHDMDHILRILLSEKSISSDALARDIFKEHGKSYVTTLLNKIEQLRPDVIELKRGDLLVAKKTDSTEQFLKDGGCVEIYKNEIKKDTSKKWENWPKKNWIRYDIIKGLVIGTIMIFITIAITKGCAREKSLQERTVSKIKSPTQII